MVQQLPLAASAVLVVAVQVETKQTVLQELTALVVVAAVAVLQRQAQTLVAVQEVPVLSLSGGPSNGTHLRRQS